MAHILFVDMHANTSLARLPELFKNAGVNCSGLAFEEKILLQTNALENRYIFPKGARVGTMRNMATALSSAQQHCNPDFLLTNDEVLIKNLLKLRKNLRSGDDNLNATQRALLVLLENSMLLEDNNYERAVTLQLAAKSGFKTPDSLLVNSAAQLTSEAKQFGYPFYLKRNFEGGGFGVFHVSSEKTLNTVISKHLSSEGIHSTNPVLMQKPSNGIEFTINFAAWKGKLLGYEVIQSLEKIRENGPSSVVQTVYRPAWEGMINKLVKQAHYTGFGGLDVFEENVGDIPNVIEVNFRPTQSLQMALQLNSTLISTFSGYLKGKRTEDVKTSIHRDNNKIAAIFPDELVRDKGSLNAVNLPSNVPWNDPTLLSVFLRKLEIS